MTSRARFTSAGDDQFFLLHIQMAMSRCKRSVSDAMKRKVAAAHGWKCAACGILLESTWHTDHVVPLWDGGRNDFANLQPLCVSDHASKTQSEAIERARRKASLEAASASRAPLECTSCGHVCSPYFLHRCVN